MSYIRNMETEVNTAAFNYAKEMQSRDWNDPLCMKDVMADFRAGAAWQAQQPPNESQFRRYIFDELSAAGYFMADCDQELMKRNNPDWKPYSSKTFGEMLMDFACQWNMEHEGRDYRYKLKED